MSRNKGGRPPKAGPRKPCGRLREIKDIGSLELLSHRALAINPVVATRVLEDLRYGSDEKQMTAIQTLTDLAGDRRSSSQLGILLARHIINGAQHFAGSRYAGLYRRATHKVGKIQSTLGSMIGGSGGTSADISDDDQQAYVGARAKLRQHGDRVAFVVEAVAVFDEIVTDEKIDQLKIGLNALRSHFERG